MQDAVFSTTGSPQTPKRQGLREQGPEEKEEGQTEN